MKLLLLIILLFSISLGASASEDLEAWPDAADGERRMVFHVPTIAMEKDYKVEIIVGQDMEVDCNGIHVSAKLIRESIEGWGYPLYRLSDIGRGVSTMMACPETEAKSMEFVALQGQGFLQNYNSKLPYVVYVPSGYEVKYRVWSAGESISVSEQ